MVSRFFHILLLLVGNIIATPTHLAADAALRKRRSRRDETTPLLSSVDTTSREWQMKAALKKYALNNNDEEAVQRDIGKGLTFTRNIESIPHDASFTMNLDSDHCTERDSYGDNGCHYSWGEVVVGNYTVYVSEQIESTDYFVGKATIDKFVPYEFKCSLCGEDCVLTIPVVHINLTIPMPPHCPIPVQTMQQQLSYRMWNHSPTDGVISTRIDGRVSVIQGSTGKSIASFTIEAYLK